MAGQDDVEGEEARLRRTALRNAQGIMQARRGSEEEVRQHTEWLRVTLSSIGDAVITTDDEGRVTFTNPVAELLTGWPMADALGQSLSKVFQIVNESTREPVENPALRALRDGTIVGLANHTVLIARDKTERPIDDSAAPIRNSDGEVVGCVLVFRDITGRRQTEKALERSEARKSAIFEKARDAIVSIDHEGAILEFNASAERMFGYRREEVVGRNLAETLVPPVHREAFHAGLARYVTTRDGLALDLNHELSALRADGSEIPVELFVTRTAEAGPPVFTAYLRDLTERKYAAFAVGRLATIIGSSADAIISKDLDGVITSWNQSAERMFGYTAAEAIGRNITLIIPKERLAEEDDVLARVRSGERVEYFETERVSKDQRHLIVSLTGSPVKDVEGRTIGASKIARDITAQKRNEQALRESEFRTLADNMSQFAWMADAKGSLYWYNRRWYEYTGTTLEEMKGWGWTRVHHPDHVDAVVKRVQRSWDTGEPWEDVFPLRGKDGGYRWFLSRALPIRDEQGHVVRWLGTNTDITEQRLAEEALKESYRRKDEFLAMLAHELRNPLAPIRNAIGIIEMAKSENEGIQSATAILDRQVKHMVRLIEDLLDVSRITRGKIELRLEVVDLHKVVQCAVEDARPAIDAAGHELVVTTPADPILLHADPIRLSQSIGNLLNNACKYTAAGGKGRIGLTVELRQGDVLLVVEDNGVGIPAEMLSRIFELFTQVDAPIGQIHRFAREHGPRSLEHSQGGLGIGLGLVKALVEIHGGEVTAASEGQGKGSRFTIRLPLSSMQPAQGSCTQDDKNQIAERRAATAVRRRILVVDDNRDSATSLAKLLHLAGHETLAAFDGLEALDAAAKFRPDVMLLDIGLPKMNGYEVARTIRAEVWGGNVVLIALTGWGQEGDRQSSTMAGFDAHLVKPIEMDVLNRLLSDGDVQKQSISIKPVVKAAAVSTTRPALPAPTPFARMVHEIRNYLTCMQLVVRSVSKTHNDKEGLVEVEDSLSSDIKMLVKLIAEVEALWKSREAAGHHPEISRSTSETATS